MKKLLLILSLAFSLNAFSQVPSYVPTSGLVGWWPFTGNAIDSSGNGNNGTLGGPIYSTDRFGNANRAINMTSNTDLVCISNSNSSPNVFSYSVWFKSNSTIAGFIVGFDNGQCSHAGLWDRYLIIDDTTQVRFYTFPGGTVNNTAAFNILDNNWHNIIVTMGSIGSKIYIDGTLRSINASQTSGQGYTGYFRLGGLSPQTQTLIGYYDDWGIWNRALDSCEVKDLYFASLGNCSGVGLNEVSQSKIFTVYPNPTNSTLTINTKAIYSSIQIVNTLGQLIFTKEKSTSLNVSSLPSGIYFIQLLDNKGSIIGKEKFVKE